MALLMNRASPSPRGDGFGSRIGLPDALRGLREGWRSSRNARIETIVAGLALAGSGLLGVSPVPVLLCMGLVIGFEMLNSAIEHTLDLASPDTHPLARDAKDMAAGAVLLAAIISVLVGVVHLGPPLWTLFSKGWS